MDFEMVETKMAISTALSWTGKRKGLRLLDSSTEFARDRRKLEKSKALNSLGSRTEQTMVGKTLETRMELSW